MYWLNLLLVVFVGLALAVSTVWGIYRTYKIHRKYAEKKGDRP